MPESETTVRTPRVKPRQRKIAALAFEGKKYPEIGREVYPNSAYPRQQVYNALQQPGTKQAMAELATIVYNEDYLRRKLTKIIEEPENQRIEKDAIELAMRSLAMLTDKTQNLNQNTEIPANLGTIPADQLENELLKRLKMSSQGVDITPKPAVETHTEK